MKKLQELIEKCRASVTIDINSHRDFYMSAAQYLDDVPGSDLDETEQEVIDNMILKDTIIELQFYPKTPVGFYKIYHYDVEMAIDEALKTLAQ